MRLGRRLRRQRIVLRRILLVASVLGRDQHKAARSWRAALDVVVAGATASELWLLVAVVSGQLPHPAQVEQLQRVAARGDRKAFARELMSGYDQAPAGVRTAAIEIARDHTMVLRDFGDMPVASSFAPELATRVADIWRREHGSTTLSWHESGGIFRALDTDESERLVVPWQGNLVSLVPQTAPDEASRLQALARFSGVRTASVGFGMGPISFAEEFDNGINRGRDTSPRYEWDLAAVREMDLLVSVSDTAAREYAAWTQMLPGLGVAAPALTTLGLPREDLVPPPPERGAIGIVVEAENFNALHTVLTATASLIGKVVERIVVSIPSHIHNFPPSSAPAGLPLEFNRSTSVAERAKALSSCEVVIHAANYCSHAPVLDLVRLSGRTVIRSDIGYLKESGSDKDVILASISSDHIIAAIREAVGRTIPARAGSPRDWSSYAAELWALINAQSSAE